jgi:hypothetical protein
MKLVQKIGQTNRTKGITIACAGDMDTAPLIADTILSGWEDEHLLNPEGILENFCESVPDTEKKRAQCMVVLTRPTPQIFIVNTMPKRRIYGSRGAGHLPR